MVRMICISLRAALILVLAHTTLFMGWECAPVNYKPNLWYQSPTFSTESLVLAVLHVAAAIFVIISLLGDIELQILMMMMNVEHATTNSDTAANVGWSKQTVLFIRKQYWRELSWHQNIPLLVFLFLNVIVSCIFFQSWKKPAIPRATGLASADTISRPLRADTSLCAERTGLPDLTRWWSLRGQTSTLARSGSWAVNLLPWIWGRWTLSQLEAVLGHTPRPKCSFSIDSICKKANIPYCHWWGYSSGVIIVSYTMKMWVRKSF